jgi:response regulator RpfG family c-di-GMP phosphodiesterase
LSRQLADQIAPGRAWRTEIAGLLSQVGCAALPDDLLNKAYANRQLKPHEQFAFDQHPAKAKELISKVPRLEDIAIIIGYQAKRFDGGGTPDDAIKGEAIPVESRILKLAIDYDTLRSNRLSVADALTELQRRKGWYDPNVLNGLKRVLAAEAARQILNDDGAMSPGALAPTCSS